MNTEWGELSVACNFFGAANAHQTQPSILLRGKTFVSAVDRGYGCGNPNINHD